MFPLWQKVSPMAYRLVQHLREQAATEKKNMRRMQPMIK
jgi:hypothetical protein